MLTLRFVSLNNVPTSNGQSFPPLCRLLVEALLMTACRELRETDSIGTTFTFSVGSAYQDLAGMCQIGAGFLGDGYEVDINHAYVHLRPCETLI